MPSDTVAQIIAGTEWYKTTSGLISAFLGIVGGGGVVAVGVSSFISNHLASKAIEKKKAELSQETEKLKATLNAELERLKGEISRETETHKTKLKKFELIQSKEIDAATELVKLVRSIYPTRSDPDDDWHEACTRVAMQLDAIENSIDEFLSKNTFYLDNEVRGLIKECSDLAGTHKYPQFDPEDPVSADAVAGVERMLEKLEAAEVKTIAYIRG
ncbi:hypothetical protein [Methylorubrum extorquens]|uniref:hypothetical protein n=1 Tax=Methylorubrum extorquens TaxID=408 RepID=UPI001EE62677|nr:hypothetical protein [Methylorubrum extorquens]MCG5249619.1 hypothetical protein [Methylorubrum extorquens]